MVHRALNYQSVNMSETGDDTVAEGSQVVRDANQQRKKRVRGGHRAHLTKLITELGTKLAGKVADHEERRLTLKACLGRKASTLSKLDEEVLEGVDDEDAMATEIEAAENLQNLIQENIIKIDKALKKEVLKDAVKSPLVSEKRKNMKLPKYRVDDFHGDPKRWRAFRDSLMLQ